MHLLDHPLIPVVEIDDVAHAGPLARALLEGGISAVEITLRTDAAVRSIARIRESCPGMLVGAGTVLDVDDARAVLEAGVQFGVSPALDEAVIGVFLEAGVPFVPGVVTPTEIAAALRLGCSLLKFFPAEPAGGLAALKAIAGPFGPRGVRFCATGGIGAANAGEYLALPIVSAVGGSWLAPRAAISGEQWSTITGNVLDAVARLRELGIPAPQ